ncbi:MAG TPA: hypothetical protein VL979_09225 [Solirubrobacteraceae bacterium]|nr:hypothetical protein [Solirubrobacteraceae bacterium]
MPDTREIREQVARESERRSRLGSAAFGAGFLYFLSSIIISETLNGAPTVGLLQGLAPAVSGVANPTVSPRAAEVKFIAAHSLPLVAGSVLSAVAIAMLTVILLVLLDATLFRRPETWKFALPLVLGGGVALVLASVGHQAASAIETHNFVSAHDYTNHAVERALTSGAVNEAFDYIDLIAGLAFAAGMIGAVQGALRVGLFPRWMGIVGMVSAVLIFLPIGGAELQIVPAFWIVMMGVLFYGKWPKEDPPAWAAGEARPWPSGAQMRAQARAAAGAGAAAGASAAAVPAPAPPTAAGSSRKRRRKRGG